MQGRLRTAPPQETKVFEGWRRQKAVRERGWRNERLVVRVADKLAGKAAEDDAERTPAQRKRLQAAVTAALAGSVCQHKHK
eukprot:2304573-Prymnesium_polylepis.1